MKQNKTNKKLKKEIYPARTKKSLKKRSWNEISKMKETRLAK